MLEQLARYWWALAIRGAAAIIFGLLALIWPGITLTALVLLFGAYALVDGVFAVASAIMGRGEPSSRRWWHALEGVAAIVAGILTFIWPGITALALLFLIAAWALVTGVIEVFLAIRLRKELEREWMLALAGVASILFGLVLMIFPGSGALALVWLIGIYAIVFGAVLVALSLKLRRHGEPTRPQPAAP
jgi:uncharacterized membrane protein HdeD (DUF308 family)